MTTETVSKQNSKTLPPGPSYHYYHEPYPILSFLYGLYCDEPWSKAEYEKWTDAGAINGVYLYEKYLDPYPNIPATARRVITHDVADLAPPPGKIRRKPRILDCDAIWDDFSNELQQQLPSEPQKSDGKEPQFTDTRPVLSALACVYLGGATSVDAIVAENSDAKKLLPIAALEALIASKGTVDAKTALDEIKPRLYAEFIAPPESW